MTVQTTTNWYVAGTHVNAESTAARHLRRQGFSVYLPLYKKLRSHARCKEWVSRPLFPRYLFVGLEETSLRWGAINSTIGVSHLISFDGRPAPVDEDIITALRVREDDKGLVTLAASSLFKKGQPVKLMSGALSERLGLFDGIDDKMRVTVLLELMGRQMRVRAPIETVQACA